MEYLSDVNLSISPAMVGGIPRVSSPRLRVQLVGPQLARKPGLVRSKHSRHARLSSRFLGTSRGLVS